MRGGGQPSGESCISEWFIAETVCCGCGFMSGKNAYAAIVFIAALYWKGQSCWRAEEFSRIRLQIKSLSGGLWNQGIRQADA